MAAGITIPIGNDLLDRIDTYFPAGSVCELYTGAPPAESAAPTGTRVASITLPASPWAAAANRQKSRSGTWQDPLADATGDISTGYFRIRRAADANGIDVNSYRLQGTISGTGGTGDMKVDNPSIVINQQVIITGVVLSI